MKSEKATQHGSPSPNKPYKSLLLLGSNSREDTKHITQGKCSDAGSCDEGPEERLTPHSSPCSELEELELEVLFVRFEELMTDEIEGN